eukprot:jgi/Undpi1/8610/HiC_scaffold_25.g11075.m1
MNAIDAGGSSWGAGVGEEDRDGSVDVSVGLVEGLLLQRPLPLPAAEAVADTLAWCDRRRHGVTDVRASATATAAAYTGRRAGGVGSWGGSKEGEGERGGLVIRALKRVAAVWAEPSFLNRSPPRQQEFYTRFLLAALRSGGVDGQGLTSDDPDALVLLIRGVGSHLDVPTRATRLQGMRVGEAVAILSGQELRFAELDGDRGHTDAGVDEAGGGEDGRREGGEKEGGGGGEVGGEDRNGAGAGARGVADVRGGKKRPKKKRDGAGGRRSEGCRGGHREGAGEEEGGKGGRLPSGKLARSRGDDGDYDVEGDEWDPDMLLPLGGGGGGGGSDSEEREGRRARRSSSDASSYEEDQDGDSDGSGDSNSDGDSYGDSSGDGDGGSADSDGFEAYDLWDDQEDLSKVAEPVYLDQLIELLHSRDQPDTADKHEVALKCAEALVRRNPPDLAHRAPELSRDLLYLQNSFELEGFETLRAGAMVATTVAAPESCVLYLGSEVWGTGATEGTKMEILDVLVQAASELAGWTNPGGGLSLSSSLPPGSRLSSLMQEPRGMTQGSVRRKQPQPGSTITTAPAPAAASATGGENDVTNGDAQSGGRNTGGVGGGGDGSPEGRATRGTRRWGYRRGPREQLRRNLFGRFAPVFFYPLAQGMILRLRQSAAAQPPPNRNRQALESGIDVGLGLALESIVKGADDGYALSSGGASPPPPPPSTLFSARLLHALTCLVELCGNCPATPSLAADLLGLAWLLRGPASGSRELRRAALIAIATGVDRSQDGAASGAMQGHAGEFLRWLHGCTTVSDSETRHLAEAVLGHSSVQALAYL